MIFNGNHGLGFLSLHPYLYNTNLGIVAEETIVRKSCLVEDDVWVGHNSVICPSVRSVGRGSVVAAGAVVTKDVPRYALVAGVPARIVKFRFTSATIDKIENSRWWLQDAEHLRALVTQNPTFVYAPESVEP